MLRAGINVVTTGDFVTGTHHPVEPAALEAGRSGGRRDVSGHRIRAGLRQRRRGLSHRRVPRRCTASSSSKHWTAQPIPCRMCGRCSDSANHPANACDAPRSGAATIRPRLLRDAGHDRHHAGYRARLQGGIRRARGADPGSGSGLGRTTPPAPSGASAARIAVMRNGRPVIELAICWTMSDDALDPQWTDPKGFSVVIEGNPASTR